MPGYRRGRAHGFTAKTRNRVDLSQLPAHGCRARNANRAAHPEGDGPQLSLVSKELQPCGEVPEFGPPVWLRRSAMN
jgi:hypothetical protein